MLSPDVEAHPKNSLAADHASGVGGAGVIDYCHIELAYGAEEEAAVGTVPHHRQLRTVIERERHLLDIGVNISFAYAHDGRLADAKHPLGSKHPVVAIAKAQGIIMGVDAVSVIGPCVRQLVAKLRRQTAEIEPELLGIYRKSRVERTLALFLHAAEIERCSLGISLMIEKIVSVYTPGIVVDGIKAYVKMRRVVLVAKAFDSRAYIVFYKLDFGSKKHTVEAEAKPLPRTVHAPHELAHIHVVASRQREIRKIDTHRCRRVGVHQYVLVVRSHEAVAVEPAFSDNLGIELIAGSGNICSVVAVEKAVAPAVGIHHKTWKLSPLRYRIQIKRQRASLAAA